MLTSYREFDSIEIVTVWGQLQPYAYLTDQSVNVLKNKVVKLSSETFCMGRNYTYCKVQTSSQLFFWWYGFPQVCLLYCYIIPNVVK